MYPQGFERLKADIEIGVTIKGLEGFFVAIVLKCILMIFRINWGVGGGKQRMEVIALTRRLL